MIDHCVIKGLLGGSWPLNYRSVEKWIWKTKNLCSMRSALYAVHCTAAILYYVCGWCFLIVRCEKPEHSLCRQVINTRIRVNEVNGIGLLIAYTFLDQLPRSYPSLLLYPHRVQSHIAHIMLFSNIELFIPALWRRRYLKTGNESIYSYSLYRHGDGVES